jgi:hypothetical protein
LHAAYIDRRPKMAHRCITEYAHEDETKRLPSQSSTHVVVHRESLEVSDNCLAAAAQPGLHQTALLVSLRC